MTEQNYIKNKAGATMIGKWEKRGKDFVVLLKTNRAEADLIGGVIYAESKAGKKELVWIDNVIEIQNYGDNDRWAVLHVTRKPTPT